MKLSATLQEDIDSFSLAPDQIEKLRGSRVVVTGATGLIGSMVVRCLAAQNCGIRLIALVRNRLKAEAMFADLGDKVLIDDADICRFFDGSTLRADYVIHCASPTNGRYITDHPAETYMLAITTMREILEYARRNPVKGVVYLSSIEVCGQIFDNDPVDETRIGSIDPQSPRSSYALGKLAAEYMVFCYAREYGVPATVARLTQTFGAGIAPDDNRVFAQFARSVIDGHDIELHTEGRSAKPYCYTVDCVSALIYILLKGQPGEVYNVATPGSYVTVRRLGELFCDIFNPEGKVVVVPVENAGYAPDTTVNLAPDKLLALGWQPRVDLPDMLRRLVRYLREVNNSKK